MIGYCCTTNKTELYEMIDDDEKVESREKRIPVATTTRPIANSSKHGNKSELNLKQEKENENSRTAPTMDTTNSNSNNNNNNVKNKNINGNSTNDATSKDKKENKSKGRIKNVTIINKLIVIKHSGSHAPILESVLNDDIDQFKNDIKNMEIDFEDMIEVTAKKEKKSKKHTKMCYNYAIEDEVFDLFEQLVFYSGIYGSYQIFNYLLDIMKLVDKEELAIKKLMKASYDKSSISCLSKCMQRNSKDRNEKIIDGKKRSLLSLFDVMSMVLTKEEILFILLRENTEKRNLVEVLTHVNDKSESSLQRIQESVICMCVFLLFSVCRVNVLIFCSLCVEQSLFTLGCFFVCVVF